MGGGHHQKTLTQLGHRHYKTQVLAAQLWLPHALSLVLGFRWKARCLYRRHLLVVAAG
jgi:hypothetical protein